MSIFNEIRTTVFAGQCPLWLNKSFVFKSDAGRVSEQIFGEESVLKGLNFRGN